MKWKASVGGQIQNIMLNGGGFRARLRSYNYLCHYYIYLHKADDAKQEVEAW